MEHNRSGRTARTWAGHAGLGTSDPATRTRPVLRINPVYDRAFVAVAEALLDDGPRALPAFQDALRQRFADAVVRARDLSGEADAVWYLFRDGRWVDGGDGREPVLDG